MTSPRALEPEMPPDNGASDALIPLTIGDILRRALAVILPLVVLGSAVHMSYDVGTLIGWFPVCLLVSLVLEFAIAPTRSWWALLFAIIAPVGTIVCAAVIVDHEWGPDDAQLTISLLWWSFAFAVLAAGVPANWIIWNYRHRANAKTPFRWQFPIRLILALMFVLSGALALAKFAIPHEEAMEVFGYGAALVFFVVGIAFCLFVANLRVSTPTRSITPWDEPETPEPLESPPTP
jgi:hypothetical protein